MPESAEDSRPTRPGLSLPPSKVIGFSLALSLAAAVLCMQLALGQPHLGLKLEGVGAGAAPLLYAVPSRPGLHVRTAVKAIGVVGQAPVFLRGDDLSTEPDAVFSSYASFNRFLVRQGQLAAVQRAADVDLYFGGGPVRLHPASHRPVSDLPFIFWLQLISALGCWLTGSTIYAFRPDQPAAKYFATAGFGALLMAASAAVYSSRELALPEQTFRLLSAANHFGALLTAGAFVAVLWYYPRALARWRPGPWLVLGYLLVWAGDYLQWLPLGNLFQEMAIIAGYLFSLFLALLQWRAARNDPVRRAALQWFFIFWFVGSGALVIMASVPAIAGLDGGRLQAYAFGFLLFISIGLALGISRYRLFDLEIWWFRAVVLVVGGFSVVGLDVLFAAAMHLETPTALAASLILAGWLYFPVRQWFMARFLTGARRLRVDDVPGLLRDVLAPDAYAVEELLPEALHQLYKPLSLRPMASIQQDVAIADDGLSLRVPGIGTFPSWEARFPGDGQRLFTRRDAEVASAVRAVLDRVAAYQVAVERSVEQERARVAQDLHDDIGARLLTVLHRSEDETAQIIRDVIASLRLTVYGLGARPQSIADCLANWRAEAGERCEATDVRLDWREYVPQGGMTLDAPQQLNLARVLREAITNALRHARPTGIQVTTEVTPQGLRITVINDGAVSHPQHWRTGLGLRGMDRRMQRLGGSLDLQGDAQSTWVTINLPLQE